jgi:hypothetical protein
LNIKNELPKSLIGEIQKYCDIFPNCDLCPFDAAPDKPCKKQEIQILFQHKQPHS